MESIFHHGDFINAAIREWPFFTFSLFTFEAEWIFMYWFQFEVEDGTDFFGGCLSIFRPLDGALTQQLWHESTTLKKNTDQNFGFQISD